MRIDWTLTGCTQEDERAITSLWETIQPAFEARLGALPEEAGELLIGVDHQFDEPGTPEWTVQAVLHLPAAILAAERGEHDLGRALDEVVGDLGRQLDAVADQPIEVSRRRQGLEAVLPLLERYHSADHSAAFFKFLQPLVRSLGTYVRRELALLRTEGALAGEGIETSDVLDDVLLRAWDRFDRRPRDGRFDVWLIKLINESLASCLDAVPHESLEERVPLPEPEPHATVYEETWTEQATYPETMELADVLAGREGLNAWDDLEVESKQMGLARLLRDLSPSQRHALVLNAAEGYEPAEIADIQDRALEEVIADLAAAQDGIRRQFQTTDELEDVEDRLDQSPGRQAYRRKG